MRVPFLYLIINSEKLSNKNLSDLQQLPSVPQSPPLCFCSVFNVSLLLGCTRGGAPINAALSLAYFPAGCAAEKRLQRRLTFSSGPKCEKKQNRVLFFPVSAERTICRTLTLTNTQTPKQTAAQPVRAFFSSPAARFRWSRCFRFHHNVFFVRVNRQNKYFYT